MKVYKTKSYKKFHLLPMNREIIATHASKMADSIKSMGSIRPIVCCETAVVDGINKLWVLDGQHLLTGLERLKKEVHYIKIDVKDELDIVRKMGLLNSSSKSWTMMDYVNAYKMYIPDYMILFKLRNLYNIEIGMLAAICQGEYAYDHRGGATNIKEGDFKVTNADYDRMCSDFAEQVGIIPEMSHNLKRKYLRAFMSTEGNYDHKKIIKNMKKYKGALEIMGNDETSIKYIQKNIFGMEVSEDLDEEFAETDAALAEE